MSFSKKVKVDLSKAKATALSAKWRNDGFTTREGWVFRLSLKGENDETLPLFVHLYQGKRGLTAELESDQTDYDVPDWPHSIKRTYLKNLSFWK